MLGPAIGFALNLPAVCGAIVAIGITADSFIVYFERIRDEIREGRTLRPAVERGWPRARRTILVSDFVSFLAAAVLFIVTVGKVQGFAFTLGLTTAPRRRRGLLLHQAADDAAGPAEVLLRAAIPWSGLDPKRLGRQAAAAPPSPRRRPHRPEGGVRCRDSAIIGARLYRGEVGYDFVGKRKIWYGVSILITITAIVGLAVRGLNMGIEFYGGAVFTTPEDHRVRLGGASDEAEKASGGHQAIVQKLGDGGAAHPDQRSGHRAGGAGPGGARQGPERPGQGHQHPAGRPELG